LQFNEILIAVYHQMGAYSLQGVGRDLTFRKQFLALLATMIAELYLARDALAFDGKLDGYALIWWSLTINILLTIAKITKWFPMEEAAKLRYTFKSVIGNYRRRKRDNGIPKAGQRQHFTTRDDFTGLPRTSLCSDDVCDHKLSQDCIVLLREDGSRVRRKRRWEKRCSRHFPTETKRSPFLLRIIAQ